MPRLPAEYAPLLRTWAAVTLLAALLVAPAAGERLRWMRLAAGPAPPHSLWLLAAPDVVHARTGWPVAREVLPPWADAQAAWRDRSALLGPGCPPPVPPDAAGWQRGRWRGLPAVSLGDARPDGVGDHGGTLPDGPLDWEAMLPLGRVEVGEGGRACPWVLDRFRCGPEPWHWVGAHSQPVGGQTQPCVWFHPHEGAPLRWIFEGLRPAGTLEVELGLHDAAADPARQGRFTLQVTPTAAGDAGHRTLGWGRGWQRRRIAVEALGPDQPLVIALSADTVGQAHACLRWSWTPAAGDTP